MSKESKTRQHWGIGHATNGTDGRRTDIQTGQTDAGQAQRTERTEWAGQTGQLGRTDGTDGRRNDHSRLIEPSARGARRNFTLWFVHTSSNKIENNSKYPRICYNRALPTLEGKKCCQTLIVRTPGTIPRTPRKLCDRHEKQQSRSDYHTNKYKCTTLIIPCTALSREHLEPSLRSH